jgi:serine/threonine protein kinase
MTPFRYQHGDRPLDGYTIEHGLGRGGFGEVYYAISDSGRQVALKAIQNYEDVELRGIRHCMNLKSPHLVSIFDVKRNDDDQPFVIMEFVSGPSLRRLLDDSLSGLGPAKAAYFLREMAKGLTYLHDCGIVHRDLKPHNVFYEDGFVKIGDYSLSKAMTTSHRSGHTMTVGTVHYMAPEISMGRYDHTVDIYALGAILHEMLTGRPPFEGESVGEVLMKHMATDVDVQFLEEPFATVIRKSLAKDPAERYQSAAEMVEAVFGAEHVQNSVTALGADSLSVVAQKAARKLPLGATAATQPYAPSTSDPAGNFASRPDKSPSGGFAFHAGQAAAQVASHVGLVSARRPPYSGSVHDPLGRRQRVTLAAITAIAFSIGVSLLPGNPDFLPDPPIQSVLAFLMIVGVSLSVVVTRRWILPHVEDESSVLSRLAFGGISCAAALPAIFMVMGIGHAPMSATLVAILFTMFVLDWRIVTAPFRAERLSPATTLFAAVVAAIATGVFDGYPLIAAAIAAAIVLTIQVSCAFDPSLANGRTKRRSPVESIGLALQSIGEPPVRHRQAPLAMEPARTAGKSTESTDAEVSPKLRLIALLLSLIYGLIGIAGLHRFYVGKIFTGLLWLVTFGLAGIGQLVDIILIAVGAFRDSDGRPVLTWTDAGKMPASATRHLHSKPVNHYSSIPGDTDLDAGRRLQMGSIALAMIGGLLLAPALLLGLALALDIPSAIAADVFKHADLRAEEITEVLGMSNWTGLMQRIGILIAGFLGFFAISLLIVSRRGLGVVHMLRVLISGVGFVVALNFLHLTVNRVSWPMVGQFVEEERIGPVLDAITSQHNFVPSLVAAAVFSVASLFVLAWPAKRRRALAPPAPTPQPQPQPEGIKS